MNQLCPMSFQTSTREIQHDANRSPKHVHAQCTCCPYGYHIDRDFVRYCESLDLVGGGLSEHDSAAHKRKERRRQRQSMEVLLGLVATPATTPVEKQQISATSHRMVNDALQDVVSDFERTLATQEHVNRNCNNDRLSPNYHKFNEPPKPPERSPKNMLKFSNARLQNIPSIESSISIENSSHNQTSHISPPALQTIREQMALSLERMRHLEEQVQSIPALHVQISVLLERNRNLVTKLTQSEKNNACKCLHEHHNLPRHRSSSFTDISGNTPQLVPVKRDVAVSCSVITREIGVGGITTPNISTNQVSTQTHTEPKPMYTSKQSQTQETKPDRRSFGAQINAIEIQSLYIAEKCNATTQVPAKLMKSSGVVAKPQMKDLSTMTQSKLTHEVGVGTTSVSLSSVLGPMMARSKSFNMGEESLNLSKRTRSTASQYTLPTQFSKFVQTNKPDVTSTASQHEASANHTKNKGSQSDNVISISKSNNTDIPYPVISSPVETYEKSTQAALLTLVTTNNTPVKIPLSPTVSRIPRPATLATPPEVRRLKRQQTYTKITTDEFKKDEESSSSIFDSIKVESKPNDIMVMSCPAVMPPSEDKSIFQESRSQTPTPSTKVFEEMTSSRLYPTADHLNTTFTFDNKQRQSVTPSKEMRAAMKVVNDFLLKTTSNKDVNHMKNATNIIQQEWFKISSTDNANPLDVEDYMDCIEEVSNELLHYVVNMIDNNGNTAMHYAVSHGNFDVVSILLDSKVCNINRPNVAGYTAIMLLSLAEIRSPTHSNVIRKLFQIADVNIKAKEHGQTALMLAVSHGRFDMASLLLEAGADVNIQDDDGSTALMCAAEHGYTDIVRLFLSQSDCDSSLKDEDGSTALKIALEAGHRDIGVLLYAHDRMKSGASPYSSLNRRKSGRSSLTASPKLSRSPMPSSSTTNLQKLS